MTPTRARTLAAAAVSAGVLVYLPLRLVYDDIPRLPRTAPLSLLLVGLVEAQAAVLTRARLARRPGTRPILPLTVARLAALAKASSLAGAVLAGAWAAVLAYTVPRADEIGVAGADAITAGLGLGAAVVLVAAALLLERVCRVPGRRR
ncbi:MAG TPA: DUF3180 domain-containing protein [Frankiaceae bacterium]|nr:DUF3180 domain-containing protein [Frankiaceae bacterium]